LSFKRHGSRNLLGLCVTAAMPMVFGSALTLSTFFFFFTFFQAYMLPLGVSVRLGLGKKGLELG